ncbi:Ropporin-1-like protein [Eufriesea mexicana]|nr:Ropporin-1-like protein [Eufriesea mexicana]
MSDIYCAEQINIPPTFPHILRQYAKAAIRTQPYDLLQWTCAYFRALANCDVPPVKERLEYPPFCHPSGITPGYLRTLLNVFGHAEKVCLKSLLERWQGVALPETTLFRILLVGRFSLGKKECRFYEFLAIACGFLAKNLFETMIYVCELLTEEPEGGSAMIPLRTFVRLYEYLAKLDCSGECACVIMEEDTKELSLPVSEQPGTSDSRLYVTPSSTVHEDEDTAGLVDVCGFTPSESRSSRTVQFSKDYVIDTRRSEVGEIPRPSAVSSPRDEIEVGSMDRETKRKDESEIAEGKAVDEVAAVELPRATIPDFHLLDRGYSIYDRDDDDSYVLYGEEEYEEKAMDEQIDDYQPIGLESILHGICECLEPVRETPRVPTPPPPDPFAEFLKRMKQEVEEDRLETRFRVDGIGAPVSTNRITAVTVWLADCGRRQDGLVGPRNIRHFLCPDLEDPCNDND